MSDPYGVEVLVTARARLFDDAETAEREGDAAFVRAEGLHAQARVMWERADDIASTIQKLRESK